MAMTCCTEDALRGFWLEKFFPRVTSDWWRFQMCRYLTQWHTCRLMPKFWMIDSPKGCRPCNESIGVSRSISAPSLIQVFHRETWQGFSWLPLQVILLEGGIGGWICKSARRSNRIERRYRAARNVDSHIIICRIIA